MKRWWIMLVVVLLGVLAVSVSAQDMMASPSVVVTDQLVLGGTVDVATVYSAGPGFIVIHNSSNQGVGPGIGVAPVAVGWTYNLRIPIDTSMATPVLSAMLHEDTGEVGKYEFGTVAGADGPVSVNGAIVNPTFNVQVLSAADQFVEMDQITIKDVTVPADSFVVIHAGDAASFGAVLGYAAVPAGTSTNVTVSLAADGRTEVLWPMLHVDTGVVGEYEFGTVAGADGPVVLDGNVATFPIWTVPHMRVLDQAIVYGDNRPGMGAGEMMTPTLVAASVLLTEPGFLVIHQEADGRPGPVAGVSDPLPAGLSTNVRVALDSTMLTPRLWPMLHADTGAVGIYEFGTVPGADAPLTDSAGSVLTFAINAAPSITVMDGPLTSTMGMDNSIYIELAVIDAPGWIAVHTAGPDGRPSAEVIATHLLHPGRNWHIYIPVDPAKAGTLVFPMLHYDTGEMGVYEFGTVAGADAPVLVGGAPVVPPLNIAQ